VRGAARSIQRFTDAAVLAALALAFLPHDASAEPAFGEPGWVAPGYGDAAWQAAAVDTGALGADASGPRVAAPDHDPTGETVLRAPFRLLFLPLRLVARGSESLIAVAGPLVVPHVGNGHPPLWSLQPIVTPDPSLGLGVTRRLDPWGNSRIQLNAIYGWRDRRRARFIYSSARDSALKALTVVASYNFRPNWTFYGVGNQSSLANKSYWLGRRAGERLVRFGRRCGAVAPARGRLVDLGALGFQRSAGTERVEDVFTPEEAPFLQRASVVVSYGLAARSRASTTSRRRTSAFTSRARPSRSPASTAATSTTGDSTSRRAPTCPRSPATSCSPSGRSTTGSIPRGTRSRSRITGCRRATATCASTATSRTASAIATTCSEPPSIAGG
jgi:hypothetical protein